MKFFILLCLMVIVFCNRGYCQIKSVKKNNNRIDSIHRQESAIWDKILKPIHPIYIVISHKKQYIVDTAYSNHNCGIEMIKPQWIKAIRSIQPSVSEAKNMEWAKHGAVIITLNDKTYPQSLKKLQGILNRATLQIGE